MIRDHDEKIFFFIKGQVWWICLRWLIPSDDVEKFFIFQDSLRILLLPLEKSIFLIHLILTHLVFKFKNLVDHQTIFFCMYLKKLCNIFIVEIFQDGTLNLSDDVADRHLTYSSVYLSILGPMYLISLFPEGNIYPHWLVRSRYF